MISTLNKQIVKSEPWDNYSLRLLLLHLQCTNHVYFTGLLWEYYIRFKDLCCGAEHDGWEDRGKSRALSTDKLHMTAQRLFPETRWQQAGLWGGWKRDNFCMGNQVWPGRVSQAFSGLANSNNSQAPRYRAAPGPLVSPQGQLGLMPGTWELNGRVWDVDLTSCSRKKLTRFWPQPQNWKYI